MKKAKIFIPFTAIAVAALVASCGNNPTPSSSAQSTVPSVEPSSSSSSQEPIVYGVAIANKSALQEAWYMGETATRTLEVNLTPTADAAAAIAANELKIVSSNTAAIAVNGLALNAVAAGKSTITVTYHDKTDTVEVEVLAAYSLAITNKEALQEVFRVGDTIRQVELEVSPAINISSEIRKKTLVVASSNEEVVSVNGKGLTPVGVGKATITVSFHGQTDSFEVEVFPEQEIQNITDTLEETENLKKGETSLNRIRSYAIVKKIDSPYNESNKNITLTLADEFGETISGYQLSGSEEVDLADIWVGDVIEVYGRITNYNGTFQYVRGTEITKARHAYAISLDVKVGRTGVRAGETVALSASATAEDTLKDGKTIAEKTVQTVTWSSENEEIATVDENGVVTAKAAGKVKIKATSTYAKNDKGEKAEKEVELEFAAAATGNVVSLALGAEKETFNNLGETKLVRADLQGEEGHSTAILWTSSNEKVATVDANGNVKSIGVGKAEITATTVGKDAEGNNLTAKCEVEVAPATVAETLQAVANVASGSTTTEKYLARGVVTKIEAAWDASYGNITFWIADEDNASIGLADKAKCLEAYRVVPAGDVKGAEIAVGDVVICYGNIQNYNGTYEFPAKAEVLARTAPIASAVEIKGAASVAVDENIRLSAEVAPAYIQQNVKWSSSDEAVAKVNGGIVTGVAEGTAKIKATSVYPDKDGKEVVAEFDVTVTAAATGKLTSMTFSNDASVIHAYGEHDYHVVLEGEEGHSTGVTYETSDEDVFTVDAEGKIKVVGFGKATLKATSSGKDAEGKKLVAEKEIEFRPYTLDEYKAEVLDVVDPNNIPADIKNTEVAIEGIVVAYTKDADKWSTQYKNFSPNLAASKEEGAAKLYIYRATVEAKDLSGNKMDGAKIVEGDTLIVRGKLTSYKGAFQLAQGGKVINLVNEPISAVDVTIKKGEATLPQYETTLQLQAAVTPATASQTVEWSSEDPSIATVDSKGNVTGVSKGTTKIIATAKGTEVKGEFEVTVSDPLAGTVSGLVVDDDIKLFSFKDSYTLKTQVTGEGDFSKVVYFSSSDESVVKVDATGKLTPVGFGDAIVTVQTAGKTSSGENISIEVKVAVVDSAFDTVVRKGIAVDRYAKVIQKAENGFIVDDGNAGVYVNTSNYKGNSKDPAIGAIVRVQGTVAAAGAYEITPTKITTKVNEHMEDPEAIALKDAEEVEGGVLYTLSGLIASDVQTAPKFAYGEDELNVAKYNSKAVALENGVAYDITFYFTEHENFESIYLVSAKETAPTAFAIGDFEGIVDKEVEIPLTPTPAGAKLNIDWFVSDLATAKVVNGKLLGIAEGKVTLIGTIKGTDISVTKQVSIIVPKAYVTSLELDAEEAEIWADDEEKTVQINATVEGDEGFDDTLVYESSDTGIATVDEDGVVTMVGTGTAKITVSTLSKTEEGEALTAEFTVTGSADYARKMGVLDKANVDVKFVATVAAVNKKALLVYDGSNYVYAYCNKDTQYEVGDVVLISGYTSLYNGCIQVSFNNAKVTSGEHTYTKIDWADAANLPVATKLTKELADGFIAAEGEANKGASNADIARYTWVATVGKSGTFFILPFEGSDVVIEPIQQSQTLTEGETVLVDGYFFGYSKGKSAQYAQIILVSVEGVN